MSHRSPAGRPRPGSLLRVTFVESGLQAGARSLKTGGVSRQEAGPPGKGDGDKMRGLHDHDSTPPQGCVTVPRRTHGPVRLHRALGTTTPTLPRHPETTPHRGSWCRFLLGQEGAATCGPHRCGREAQEKGRGEGGGVSTLPGGAFCPGIRVAGH